MCKSDDLVLGVHSMMPPIPNVPMMVWNIIRTCIMCVIVFAAVLLVVFINWAFRGGANDFLASWMDQ
jgi:hypothetical protein